MLPLLMAVALAQAPLIEDLTPPPPPPAMDAVEPAPPGPVPAAAGLGRKPGFFSAPKVSTGTLLGRVGMGVLLGSLVGGGLGTVFVGIGGLFAGLSGSYAGLIIAAPLALIALAVGTALGAALFGKDYGRDLADAVSVALVCALVSVTAALIFVFAIPSAVGSIVAVGAGLLFPAIATPLLVQAFKKEDAPQPTIALATF